MDYSRLNPYSIGICSVRGLLRPCDQRDGYGVLILILLEYAL